MADFHESNTELSVNLEAIYELLEPNKSLTPDRRLPTSVSQQAVCADCKKHICIEAAGHYY